MSIPAIYSTLETFTETEIYAMFDTHLDERYGLIEIAGHEYDVSRALRKTDNKRYQSDFLIWFSDSNLIAIHELGTAPSFAFQNDVENIQKNQVLADEIAELL